MANEPESHFNQRADNAALALKQGMVDARSGEQLQSVPVQVGPDGKLPPPPPPPGSYAAMALEQEQAAFAAHQAQQPQVPAAPAPAHQQQILGQQPLVGPGEVTDGSQAPPLGQQQAQPEPQGDLSPNAQQRFSEMSARLRTMEQQNQQLMQELEAQRTSGADMQKKLEEAQKAQQEILQANLDELDPDTRARVLADSRMQEMFAQMEQRLTQRFMPHIETLEIENQRNQMMKLAEKYPAFDVQVHAPLIEMYRGKNPHSSVEQAFKAIAQDGELVTRDAASLQVAPPIVAPGGNGVQQPRYMPEPQADPEQAMREDAQRAAQLMRSGNHADHREGMRLIDKNITDRLRDMLPG